eukprot:g84.t1
MFEARFQEGAILKKLVDALKDIVQDANLDCSASGISLQAMDSSHVSLCAVMLRSDLFDHYRCDRTVALGINFTSLSKILKCASNDDMITMKADDEGEAISFMFESEKCDKISDFEMKLMNIDSEHLGIPDTEYKTTVRMPASEFMKIINDLSVLGDTCQINASKDGVKFSVQGDLGTGNITCRQSAKGDMKDEEKTIVEVEEPMELTFALRYLKIFTKASPLATTVCLRMSPEVPLVVEYGIGESGYVRYYLAPKIDEE